MEAAHSLLDKEERRRSMRFMPSATHDEASGFWVQNVTLALAALVPHQSTLLGCKFIGTRTYQLRERKKQADAAFRPTNGNSQNPSVVLEVGCSESLQQLKTDARLWIEHMPEVQIVIIISIDPGPVPAHPNLPRITIELWRGVAPPRPICGEHARRRNGQMVWQADWTHQAGPFYILLADMFGRGQVPDEYGEEEDCIVLDSEAWREEIIEAYQ